MNQMHSSNSEKKPKFDQSNTPTARCTFCNKTNHSASSCFKSNRHHPDPLPVVQTPIVLLPDFDRSSGSCYICSSKSHWANKCPNRSRPIKKENSRDLSRKRSFQRRRSTSVLPPPNGTWRIKGFVIFGKCSKMIIILLHLLLMRVITCEESSSYLLKVLAKIQRERQGLLDEQLGTNYNDVTEDESNDYIYVNDADEAFNNYYQSENDNQYDSTVNDETSNSNKLVHSKPVSTLPTNDLIYIYNDTIYLYKAPNSSVSLKNPIKQMQMFSPPSGKPHKGFIPDKMKLMHSSSHKHKDAIDNTDPDNLINVITGGGEGNGVTKPPETTEGGEEVEGYYYEYYPLDQIPPEFVDTISMLARPTKTPGMVSKPKKPIMPIKMMMKKKPKQPVGPLFKAMAVFVGTAVVFIVSILLLPRVKLVKAKSSNTDFNEISGQSALLYRELWS